MWVQDENETKRCLELWPLSQLFFFLGRSSRQKVNFWYIHRHGKSNRHIKKKTLNFDPEDLHLHCYSTQEQKCVFGIVFEHWLHSRFFYSEKEDNIFLLRVMHWKRVLIVIAHYWAFLVTQMIKNLPAVWETWAWPLGWEDPLEKDMATQYSILCWESSMDRGVWQATIHGITDYYCGLRI